MTSFKKKGIVLKRFNLCPEEPPWISGTHEHYSNGQHKKKSTSNNFSQEIIEGIYTARLAAMAARHQNHSKFLKILRSSKKKFPEKHESKQSQKETPLVSGTYE